MVSCWAPNILEHDSQLGKIASTRILPKDSYQKNTLQMVCFLERCYLLGEMSLNFPLNKTLKMNSPTIPQKKKLGKLTPSSTGGIIFTWYSVCIYIYLNLYLEKRWCSLSSFSLNGVSPCVLRNGSRFSGFFCHLTRPSQDLLRGTSGPGLNPGGNRGEDPSPKNPR